MDVNYRFSTPTDVPGLISFWKTYGGWDELDQESWDQRFNQSPLGRAKIAIAIAEGTNEILGQMAFFPVKITSEGIDGLAYRAFAVIIKNDRSILAGMLGMKKLTFGLNQFAAKHFKNDGAALIYHVPDPRWARWFKIFPFLKGTSFSLFTYPLDQVSIIAQPLGLSIETLSPDDQRIEEIWKEQKTWISNSIVRDSSLLSWKASLRPSNFLGVFQNGNLKSWISYEKKEASRQYLIGDVVAKDQEAFRLALFGICLAISKDLQEDEETPKLIDKISILGAPWMLATLEEFGFQKNNYKFPFFIQRLNGNYEEKKIHPMKWYICAND